MRRLLGFALTIAAVGLAHEAPAQQAPVAASVPPVQVLRTPWRMDDFGLAKDELPIDLAMTPLRLSLVGEAWPRGRAIPGCSDGAETTGNTRGGFMLERTAVMRLVPRLTLVGFSRTGCQLDAAVGGGITYTAPIAKSTWLVGSAGALVLPHGSAAAGLGVRSDVRADVVFRSVPDHTWTVGVGLGGVRLGGFF